MSKIFISHSSKDKPVIDKFFELLKLGCDLNNDDIFCSSIEAAGIKVGKDFVQWIKNKVLESDLVILFVTPNYLESKFCISEMGASWALEKEIFPILHPDLEKDIGSVYLGTNTARLDGTGLDNLKDRISDYVPKAKKNTATWSLKRKEFTNMLNDLLKDLPEPDIYTKEQYQQLNEEALAAKELQRKEAASNATLKEQVKELKDLKDPKEVAKIERNTMPEYEAYDNMIDEINKSLDKLNNVVKRCLYAHFSGEDWYPQRETWDWNKVEIKKARQSSYIEEGREEGFFTINSQHPRMTSIIDQINELDMFITEKMSPELAQKIEAENKIILNISNREYWKEEIVGENLIE